MMAPAPEWLLFGFAGTIALACAGLAWWLERQA